MVRPVLQAGVDQVFVAVEDPGEAAEVKVWPNPARDRLSVVWSSIDRPMHWSVMDLSGRTLEAGLWPAGADRMDMSVADLPRGMALLVIETDQGRREIQRIALD